MSTLKFMGFMCRARIGHFDDNGELIDQETSSIEVPLITVAQFERAIVEVRGEIEQRNAEQTKPNRAQRRAAGGKKT